MNTIDTIIHAQYVIPVEPSQTVLEYHSIVIEQGKILAILPTVDCKKHYQTRDSEQTLERLNHIVIPGLINAHTHSPMSLFRGLADDLMLQDWLQNHMWPAEQAHLCPESIEIGTTLAIAEMLRSGTTCFNEHYPFANIIAQTCDKLKMRACIGGFIINFPTPESKNSSEACAKASQLFQRYQNHPLIHCAIAPHAPYSVDDQAFQNCVAFGQQDHSLPMHIHLHETVTEITESLSQYKVRPLKRLENLGVLQAFQNRFLAVHSVHLNQDDIDLLKRYQGHVIHCPKSNLKLASGFAPVQTLIEAGINVTLGTDSAASNNSLDLFSELQTAALLAKAVSNNPTAVPAWQALQMATLNGAKALSIDAQTGSLKPGKAADLAIIEVNTIESSPLYDPISQLIYATSKQQVTDVLVSGNLLLKQRTLTQINQAKLLQQAQHWQQRIQTHAESKSTRH